MATRLLKTFVLVFCTFFALGFVLPDRAHVERDIVINASPEKVFALIRDVERWRDWTPLSQLRLEADYQVTGNVVEVASAHLSPARLTQEIVAEAAPARLITRTNFSNLGEADSAYTILPEENGAARVVWSLDSNLRDHAPFLMKPIWTYASYFAEPALGPASEQSLAQLKRVAEAS